VDDIRGTRVVEMVGSETEGDAWTSRTVRGNYYKGCVGARMQTGQAEDGRERQMVMFGVRETQIDQNFPGPSAVAVHASRDETEQLERRKER
jgi:hypothetical protein